MPSETSLKNNSTQLPKWIVGGFILIAFIGFVDATYLTAKHYLGEAVTCSITSGCEQVTSSEWSVILGIPVALLGAGYYLFMTLGMLMYIDTKKEKLLYYLSRLTVLGLLASIYFVSLQIFVINAYCLYCMGSATTSTILFFLGLIMIKHIKPKEKSSQGITNSSSNEKES